MRVSVEEAILHNLPDVVVRQLRADFREIVARFHQLVVFVDAHAVDALHHQHVRCGVRAVENRRRDEHDVLIQRVEALQIRRFGLEIHFFLRNNPHFVQHLIEVHQTAGGGVLQHLARLFEQDDVAAHDLVDALALHLDDDALPAFEDGGVRLRNGRTAQRLLVKRREHFLHRAAVGGFHHALHLLKGHGRHVRAQLFQRLAVVPRQNIRPHGEDLPQLDERRAKILDDGAEFFRRDAVQDVMLAHHVHNFAQALAILGDCPLTLRLIRAAAVLVFRRIVTFGLVRRFGRDFRRNRLLFLLCHMLSALSSRSVHRILPMPPSFSPPRAPQCGLSVPPAARRRANPPPKSHHPAA